MAAYSSGVLPLMSMSVLRGVGFLLLILLLRVVPGRLTVLELDILTRKISTCSLDCSPLTAKKKTLSNALSVHSTCNRVRCALHPPGMKPDRRLTSPLLWVHRSRQLQRCLPLAAGARNSGRTHSEITSARALTLALRRRMTERSPSSRTFSAQPRR